MNIIIRLTVLPPTPPARKYLIPSLYSKRPNALIFEQLFSTSNTIILQKLCEVFERCYKRNAQNNDNYVC